MVDASLYNITVRKGDFDGETFFEAKIRELPDVAEYAETFEEAYQLALDSIETTAELMQEQGKVMPSPMIEEQNFSGRVTLRMPKSMHASFAGWADFEDVSLNHLLVNCLSMCLGDHFAGKTTKLEKNDYALGTQYSSDSLRIVSKSKSNVVDLRRIDITEDEGNELAYG
ncbi:MAG: putative HicB family RNase H-like nuclease [Oleiphilaceae bacterium]|jgi:predicted HicB family RNase H-like nuclease